MKIPESVKPAIWGMVFGGVATMVVGFSWGGWVTNGTAGKMELASAKEAVVLAFAPICVARAEPQADMLAEMKELSSWKHSDFVAEAGWVDNVAEQYRDDVARICASALIEGMNIG